MFPFSIPAFGETKFFTDQENAAARITYVPCAEEGLFEKYCGLLEQHGFVKKEEDDSAIRRYAAYQGDGYGVFMNHFKRTGEFQIVTEENCGYFSYEDTCLNAEVPAQITQVYLEDFGMSYAVRLSDGRFIVIDGGREFTTDTDRLFACLKEGSPYEKPVIAAWIMTHPHEDHFYCFVPFVDRHGDETVIEKLLFNFPEADDLAHYPSLANQDPRFENNSNAIFIPYLWERIKKCGAAFYMVHTGQRYRIGDARLEFLSGPDDTIHCSQNINAASLVFRMELAGQTILWTGDASFSDARIPARYGETLAAEILQVPHHGFGSGAEEAQIEGFERIRPRVCLLPVNDYNAYTAMVPYRKGSHHLMTRMGVQEMITGENTRTITLPYIPHSTGNVELWGKYLTGHDNAGARTWIFTELNTGRKEDFIFTVLNPNDAFAEITIEMYFELNQQRVRFIKTKLGNCRLKKICIIDPADVDSETLYFNADSLGIKGVPENADFAVRFMSDIPLVVSHKDHAAAYHSSVND